MSIRSIGSVISCLQHSCCAAGPLLASPPLSSSTRPWLSTVGHLNRKSYTSKVTVLSTTGAEERGDAAVGARRRGLSKRSQTAHPSAWRHQTPRVRIKYHTAPPSPAERKLAARNNYQDTVHKVRRRPRTSHVLNNSSPAKHRSDSDNNDKWTKKRVQVTKMRFSVPPSPGDPDVSETSPRNVRLQTATVRRAGAFSSKYVRSVALVESHPSSNSKDEAAIPPVSQTLLPRPGPIGMITSCRPRSRRTSLGDGSVMASREATQALRENVVREWRSLYSQLAFPMDGDLPKARQGMEPQKTLATQFLSESQSEWQASPAFRKNHLVALLIGGLAHSAEMGLVIASMMRQTKGFRWRIRCDCLYYLGEHYWSAIEADPNLQRLYNGLVEQVATEQRWPGHPMPQYCLVAMLKQTPLLTCERIIDAVLTKYRPIPVPLLLVIIDYYTRQQQPERATSLLSLITETDLKSLGAHLHGRYHNLIQIDDVERTESGLNFKVLPRLLDLGLPLTPGMHNEVLDRAVALGVPDVAWEVYRFMESNGIEISARSYLVLLRNSFHRGDLDGLNLIMSSIYDRKDLLRDPFLVSYAMNIVRVVCYHERNLPATESLAHILAIYDRAYDRAPLTKLGVAAPLPAGTADGALKIPDGQQLGFTLWAYILVQRTDYDVAQLWIRFVALVQQGDPDICAMACHDMVYNGFIIYWSRKVETLENVVEILEQVDQLGMCALTELTWILVISAFLKHNQEEAAERIREMMRVRDVDINLKNWEFILKEYPHTRIATQIENALKEKEMHEMTDPASELPKDWPGLRALRGAANPEWQKVELQVAQH